MNGASYNYVQCTEMLKKLMHIGINISQMFLAKRIITSKNQKNLW